MKEPSISAKVLLLSGLLVSASAVAWLNTIPKSDLSKLSRVGLLCTLLASSAVLVFCWGALIAFLARERGWSPRVCYRLGASPFAIFGLLLFFTHAENLGAFLICLAIFGGRVCRKLAYPEFTEERAAASPPPLSLFPK